MSAAESCLQAVEPREDDILRLEGDIQEFRPVLDNINLIGPQLCQVGTVTPLSLLFPWTPLENLLAPRRSVRQTTSHTHQHRLSAMSTTLLLVSLFICDVKTCLGETPELCIYLFVEPQWVTLQCKLTAKLYTKPLTYNQTLPVYHRPYISKHNSKSSVQKIYI